MSELARNIAVVAHVDHGKTTLVDGLLALSDDADKRKSLDRAMDSGDLEKERGITITSKCTSITWKGTRINLVDTPGHADFGGEVERILGMVDAVLLVVDAFEGPMPQTRFVTKKAFELGLKPIVVVNKIDRDGCDPVGTVDKVFDLFGELEATDEQLDFPVIYASGRDRYAMEELGQESDNLDPLLASLVENIPTRPTPESTDFCMQVATLQYDDFLGYVAVGRVTSGICKVGDRVLRGQEGGKHETFRTQKLFAFRGVVRNEIPSASVGDIVGIAGMKELKVGDTITVPANPVFLPTLAVDEPTLAMTFRPNDGPFAGKEGDFVTSRNIKQRLDRELRSNIALKVEEGPDAGVFSVKGRGELHLSILIETMRREGFELCVSQPEVILKKDDAGNLLEPFETVLVQVEESYSGTVIEELARRKASMQTMDNMPGGRTQLTFRMPARGLIGYRGQFLSETRGTGIIYTQSDGYDKHVGPIRSRSNGVLIAQDLGEANTYALFTLQERGKLFVGTQVPVYGGMIVGIHARNNDLVVNPTKSKKLTNFRTTAADEKQVLTPPIDMTLEKALEFINQDELVEVTPKNIRLRKKILDHNDRKRAEKSAAGA